MITAEVSVDGAGAVHGDVIRQEWGLREGLCGMLLFEGTYTDLLTDGRCGSGV